MQKVGGPVPARPVRWLRPCVAQPIIGEMEMQCCQLSDFADPFSDFFSIQKSIQALFSLRIAQYCRLSARSCFHSARTHTHTSLSFSASVQFLFSAQQPAKKSSALIQLNIDIILLASLILHDASRAEITAQAIVIILCVFDFIKLRLNYQGFCAD